MVPRIQDRTRLVLQGRFDGLNHLNVPASHPDLFWGIGESEAAKHTITAHL
jgi:hypothetical protein